MTIIRQWANDKAILFFAWLIFVASTALQSDPASLSPGQIAYLINRGLMGAVIIYALLPLLFVKARPILFALSTLLCVGLFGVFEEVVIEAIFYPDTRGRDGLTFKGVFRYSLEALPMLTAMVLLKLGWDYHNSFKKLNLLTKDKFENELLFLKNQIHPHVLFNTLNNIYCYSLEGSPQTPKMLLKLSDLLRYMLYDSSEKFTRLRCELDYLRNYVALQKIPLEDRGHIRLSVTGEPAGLQIAPFILIAFVENCFKHSLDTQEDDIQIDIEIEISDDRLVLKSSNTYDASMSQPHGHERKYGGLGIANVKRRLELIYPGRYRLEKSDDGKQYEVRLQLELDRVEPAS